MFKTKLIATRVDDDLHEKVKKAAEKSRHRLSEFVRITLEDAVAEKKQERAA